MKRVLCVRGRYYSEDVEEYRVWPWLPPDELHVARLNRDGVPVSKLCDSLHRAMPGGPWFGDPLVYQGRTYVLTRFHSEEGLTFELATRILARSYIPTRDAYEQWHFPTPDEVELVRIRRGLVSIIA